MRNFEIVIVFKGKHFFATDERSIRSETDFLRILKDFASRFRKEQGFEILASCRLVNGYTVDIDETLKKESVVTQESFLERELAERGFKNE